MTNSHLRVLQDARPDLTGRMHLVAQNGQDISDPIGGGKDVYRDCADQLTEAIQQIVDGLIRDGLIRKDDTRI
jgi:protein-tyrosine-phosphatase